MTRSTYRAGAEGVNGSMYRITPILLVLLTAGLCLEDSARAQQEPVVIRATRINTSLPLHGMTAPRTQGQPPYEIPNRFDKFTPERTPLDVNVRDIALQDQNGSLDVTAVDQNFEGASDDDNAAVVGFRVVPPDTEGDVGPGHYVQWVNLIAEIFDKNGHSVLGPFPGNMFFQGLGGLCEETNSGDPIVLYDHLADRWLVSQFALDFEGSTFSECVGISATSDPMGPYHQYEFPFGSTLPDYPKLGVWEDAYYMTVRAFASSLTGFSYLGSKAVALEREKMLNGVDAAAVIFDVPGGTAVDGWLPADLDGPAPPAGTPGLFAGAPGTDEPDEFEIFEMTVDWANPAASSFTKVAELDVAAFDPFICSTGFRQACVPQPPPGSKLDALTFTLMHRLQFRNFGTYQTLMANHTVDATGEARKAGRTGIRWYELRNSGSSWTVHQQGTYAPDDGLHRWMGSIAMNADGDIALGYSVSSRSTFPSIRVAGQKADASGTGLLNVEEQEIHAGSGVQGQFDLAATSRWGDYSMMAVDPTDDLTFWYTQEYYANNGAFDFKTRIASFSFDETLSTRLADQSAAARSPETAHRPDDDPTKFSLAPNFPDPFNPATWITYSLPSAQRVKLTVHDMLGREVATLVDGWREGGLHQVSFEAGGLASGVYLYRIEAGPFSRTRRMSVAK